MTTTATNRHRRLLHHLWFRYAIGTVEVAGAVGLLMPRLARYAVLGLVVLLAGAVVTNLFVLHESALSVLPLLVTAVVVVAVRWPRPGSVAADR